MFDFNGITINPVQIIDASVTGADAFNYFFTMVLIFGLFSWGVGLLASIISRS